MPSTHATQPPQIAIPTLTVGRELIVLQRPHLYRSASRKTPFLLMETTSLKLARLTPSRSQSQAKILTSFGAALQLERQAVIQPVQTARLQTVEMTALAAAFLHVDLVNQRLRLNLPYLKPVKTSTMLK